VLKKTRDFPLFCPFSMDDTGFTAPANVPGQAESRSAKAQLDALLAGDLKDKPPEWFSMYQILLEERLPVPDHQGRPTGRTRPRWDWRKALYIAWSATPRERRWPKREKDLASLLGLSDAKAIWRWREKDPEIDERIARLPAQMLLDHVGDVFDALVSVAKTADPKAHQDRKLFLEITGNYQPSGALALSMTPISYIEVAEDDAE
jgi:hypothetical protein